MVRLEKIMVIMEKNTGVEERLEVVRLETQELGDGQEW